MKKWRQRFKRMFWAISICGFIGLMILLGLNLYVEAKTSSRAYDRVTDLPEHSPKVALVLGTLPRTDYFRYRIDAAYELWEAGKVSHILVSGDHSRDTYNEPEAMKEALIKKGVPPEHITCDFAGLRTLDSVIRAKEIFGVDEVIIVSQEFHNLRALLIADNKGLSAIAYNARMVDNVSGPRILAREFLARPLALADLYVLNRKPRHLGDKEPIEVAGAEE